METKRREISRISCTKVGNVGTARATNVQVRGRNPERNLGRNLTQFDVRRRIPSSSLGSWENSLRSNCLGFPAQAGGDVRITGAGVWKPGRRALASPHRDPNREPGATPPAAGRRREHTAQEAHQWQLAL